MRQGDILVASWGYDQTNASFFRVERATERTAWVVELLASVGEDRRLYPTAEVKRRALDGEPKVYRRKIHHGGGGPYLRVQDYMFAYPYGGGGAYDTIAAGYPGH